MDGLVREAAIGPLRDIKDIQSITIDQVRPICKQDFLNAMKQVRASVSEKDLHLYVQFENEFGSLSYFQFFFEKIVPRLTYSKVDRMDSVYPHEVNPHGMSCSTNRSFPVDHFSRKKAMLRKIPIHGDDIFKKMDKIA